MIANGRCYHRQHPSHPAVCPTESVSTELPGTIRWQSQACFCLQCVQPRRHFPSCRGTADRWEPDVQCSPQSWSAGHTDEHASAGWLLWGALSRRAMLGRVPGGAQLSPARAPAPAAGGEAAAGRSLEPKHGRGVSSSAAAGEGRTHPVRRSAEVTASLPTGIVCFPHTVIQIKRSHLGFLDPRQLAWLLQTAGRWEQFYSRAFNPLHLHSTFHPGV